MLLDLKQEIKRTSPSNDYPYNIWAYKTGFPDRRNMATAIDNYIKTLEPYKATLRYLAIIGDDAVVPFFRRKDPLDVEKDYPKIVRGPAGNATLSDSAQGQILTDVPYASFDATEPNFVDTPSPNLGVGRVLCQSSFIDPSLRRLRSTYTTQEPEHCCGPSLGERTRSPLGIAFQFGRCSASK